MTFRLGNGLAISLSLFKENRIRLCDALKSTLRDRLPPGSCVFLEGGHEQGRASTDVNDVFRQESFFHWTFGVTEPDFYGVVDVDNAKAHLFIPKLPDSYAVWMGKIHGKEFYKTKYDVDEVYFADDEMPKTLREKIRPSLLLVLKGMNTDSGKLVTPGTFPGIENFKTDETLLHPVISECRVFKSDKEIEVLRYACRVSCEAHKKAMLAAKPGVFEYQLESVFQHHAYHNGACRHCGYTCICATGDNASVLHYGHAAAPNTRQVCDGDLCLLDMGAEYHCYTADITITFPVNGKFSPKQVLIYEAVLAANLAVFQAAKPGVSWFDMHILAERTILEHLRNGGLVKGDVGEMMQARLGAVFMPHGLGHFLGIDVHDVHGYPQGGPERPTEPGLRSLRTVRVLQERMVITIEPGCYFIDHLLDEALANPTLSQFLVREKLDEFRGFGGVRIEDDALITRDGCECLSADVPRTVDEIEKFMATKHA